MDQRNESQRGHAEEHVLIGREQIEGEVAARHIRRGLGVGCLFLPFFRTRFGRAVLPFAEARNGRSTERTHDGTDTHGQA